MTNKSESAFITAKADLREDSFDLDDEILQALENDDEDGQVELAPKRHKSSAPGEVAETRRKPTPAALECGIFAYLPDDIVLHIISHLSASSLASLAQTCKVFSVMSRDDNLWKPLYTVRWPSVAHEAPLIGASSWKELYMEQDRRDVALIRQTEKEPWVNHFLAMVTATRETITVPPALRLAPPLPVILWGRISQWRTLKGLTDCPNPELGSKHGSCSRQGPYTSLEGGLFVCEACGWAHLCGEGCSEKLVDEPSELLVCPISGVCFDRILADREEDLRETHEVEAACDFSIAGHWGRAYSEGYNCVSEEELRQRCGMVK